MDARDGFAPVARNVVNEAERPRTDSTEPPMSKRIDFYFDFGSPTAYLAWTQLPKIAADYDGDLVFKPVLLGAIHKATNNMSPAMIPAKGAWMQQDLARFARIYGVHYEQNPFFPI